MLNRKFLPAILIFGLVAAGCGSPQPQASVSTTTTTSEVTTTTTSTTTTAPPGVVPAVGIKSYVTSLQSPNLIANISYPILGGMASSGVQGAINSAIYDAVVGYVASFEKELQNVAPSTTSPGGGNVSSQSQISGSFTKVLVDSHYVSFKFLIATYAVAAASPTMEAESLNFDLATGKLMSLSDLFSGSTYLNTLASLARSAIASQLGPNANQAFINSGTQPNASNFAGWNLAGTGLELTFSQGDVAPMASGVISVDIPLSQLSGIAINPGPLTNP